MIKLEELKNNKIMVEWELTTFCNFKCPYCYLPNLKCELSENKLEEFIKKLPKDVEIFCFGGEPFLHPKIYFIIDKLIRYNKKFIFQTNASNKTVNILKKIKVPLTIQISVHPTEITKNNIKKNIATILKYHSIRRIDIMYVGKETLKYYFGIKNILESIKILPVNGFYEEKSNKLLNEFILMKKKFKSLPFEDHIIGSKPRSIWWKDFNDGKITTYNNVCLYPNYILYSSDLSIYNCCYRKNTNGICKNTKCFLM